MSKFSTVEKALISLMAMFIRDDGIDSALEFFEDIEQKYIKEAQKMAKWMEINNLKR